MLRVLLLVVCCLSLLGGTRNPADTIRIRDVGWAQGRTFDLLIRNARILDGSGNPWVRGDVGVQHGRIAALGHLDAAAATRTIDAAGRFLAPGFIDIHSHSDGGLADPALRANVNMVAQGITLSVVNQDGRSR